MVICYLEWLISNFHSITEEWRANFLSSPSTRQFLCRVVANFQKSIVNFFNRIPKLGNFRNRLQSDQSEIAMTKFNSIFLVRFFREGRLFWLCWDLRVTLFYTRTPPTRDSTDACVPNLKILRLSSWLLPISYPQRQLRWFLLDDKENAEGKFSCERAIVSFFENDGRVVLYWEEKAIGQSVRETRVDFPKMKKSKVEQWICEQWWKVRVGFARNERLAKIESAKKTRFVERSRGEGRTLVDLISRIDECQTVFPFSEPLLFHISRGDPQNPK